MQTHVKRDEARVEGMESEGFESDWNDKVQVAHWSAQTMQMPQRSHCTDQPLAPHLTYQTQQPPPHSLSAPLLHMLLLALRSHTSQKAL